MVAAKKTDAIKPNNFSVLHKKFPVNEAPGTAPCSAIPMTPLIGITGMFKPPALPVVHDFLAFSLFSIQKTKDSREIVISEIHLVSESDKSTFKKTDVQFRCAIVREHQRETDPFHVIHDLQIAERCKKGCQSFPGLLRKSESVINHTVYNAVCLQKNGQGNASFNGGQWTGVVNRSEAAGFL